MHTTNPNPHPNHKPVWNKSFNSWRAAKSKYFFCPVFIVAGTNMNNMMFSALLRTSHTQFSSKHYFTSQNTFYFRNMVSKHCFKTLWEVFWRFSIVFWNSVLKQCFEILHMYFQNTIPKHYLKTLFQNTFSNYCFKLVLLINVWAGHRCLWKVIWNSVSKYNFEIVFWNSVLELIWNSVLK